MSAPVPFKVVIPARLGSTRLPRKVLREIHGRPLLRYVWEAAGRTGAHDVVIATDDAGVQAACQDFGADVAMTSSRHQSGTDRINEVAQARGWPPDTIVVNVQGDEPLMPPALVQRAAALLADDTQADIATLCHPLQRHDEWLDPNVVKVVMDEAGHALYFSRAPIPWPSDRAQGLPEGLAFRHIGLYAYRVAALARFSALPQSALETTEALEQLRALAHGLVIRVGVVDEAPPRGVDTEADLQAVTQQLK
jgi:3-deoxy-manno-octulosonate cytidylyltransferase (CMP-KDO synthetase)